MRRIFTLLLFILFIAENGKSQLVISEFHYNNVGTDQNEQVEIFGRAGQNLRGFRFALYDDKEDQYAVINFPDTIIQQQRRFGSNWYGVVSIPFSIPEDSKGGIALINSTGDVMEFICYGTNGRFRADDGLAQGLIADNIGAEETNSTPVGYALWRPNTAVSAFNAPLPNSFGIVNTALLPIKLKEFNVSRRGEQVGVKWVASNTESESYYEVQRSTGQNNFETLARIHASGIGEFSYSYSDTRPVKGNAIYRLKLIDPDDNTTYSHLARLKWTQKDLFINNIFPTVARSEITVQVNSDRKYSTAIEVFDFTGRMVHKKQIVLTEGNMNYQVDVGNLRSGNYTIRIVIGDEVLTGKFVRQ